MENCRRQIKFKKQTKRKINTEEQIVQKGTTTRRIFSMTTLHPQQTNPETHLYFRRCCRFVGLFHHRLGLGRGLRAPKPPL